MLQATPQSPSAGQRGKGTASPPLRYAVGVSVFLALIGYLLLRHLSAVPPERCEVRGGGERITLDGEQVANAATIAAVAASRGLPERAVTIALATAMQESALRNIGYGDRDSVGLFQQRPSQGWGTDRQIRDPVYATGEFYDALEKVPGYSRLPLTVAAQKVQKSGFPQAYAKHEADASALAAALTGREAAALTCAARSAPDAGPGDIKAVSERIAREFGASVGKATGEGLTLRFRPNSDGGGGRPPAGCRARDVGGGARQGIARHAGHPRRPGVECRTSRPGLARQRQGVGAGL